MSSEQYVSSPDIIISPAEEVPSSQELDSDYKDSESPSDNEGSTDADLSSDPDDERDEVPHEVAIDLAKGMYKLACSYSLRHRSCKQAEIREQLSLLVKDMFRCAVDEGEKVVEVLADEGAAVVEELVESIP